MLPCSSTTSPMALTTAAAKTRRPVDSSTTDAWPYPPRHARSMPAHLPQMAPTPAPTEPVGTSCVFTSCTGSFTSPALAKAASAASVPSRSLGIHRRICWPYMATSATDTTAPRCRFAGGSVALSLPCVACSAVSAAAACLASLAHHKSKMTEAPTSGTIPAGVGCPSPRPTRWRHCSASETPDATAPDAKADPPVKMIAEKSDEG
mmetsp:Transcript_2593/g.8270  ORF Transcript_2593/g.8270 Transcript_2593/m.8270 type:complete len:206 (+) Transcript_2593:1241-1858(+)